MKNELLMAKHFFAEIFTKNYTYERRPEEEVMVGPDNVEEYRKETLPTGNGSSVHLFNLILLCGAVRPGSAVIDLACGPANLLIELAKLNPQADFVGIDLSPQMLNHAKDLQIRAAVRNVRFVLGDITNLADISSQSVDLVMSTLSLHHLPNLALLKKCLQEVARVVRHTGDIHLMDFASLKRVATRDYFSLERTKGLGKFVTQDYQGSLLAAYRTEDLAALEPILQTAITSVRLRQTFGVPFFMALTSLNDHRTPGQEQQRGLRNYWNQMLPGQRKDFNDMRLFFRLGGLQTPHPTQFSEL